MHRVAIRLTSGYITAGLVVLPKPFDCATQHTTVLQAKERARDQLARRYRNRSLSDEEILHCLYSISDNNVSSAEQCRHTCL